SGRRLRQLIRTARPGRRHTPPPREHRLSGAWSYQKNEWAAVNRPELQRAAPAVSLAELLQERGHGVLTQTVGCQRAVAGQEIAVAYCRSRHIVIDDLESILLQGPDHVPGHLAGQVADLDVRSEIQ